MSLRRSWATRAVKLNSERRRAVRSPSFVLGHVISRGNILPRCVPGRLAMARLRPDAFPDGNPWQVFALCIPEGASDEKSAPPWQHIAAMHPKRAGVGKICAPCIRKAPQIAFRECMARRSCQGGALFAALAPRITHGARILPPHRRRRTARAPATPASPSRHHRNPSIRGIARP